MPQHLADHARATGSPSPRRGRPQRERGGATSTIGAASRTGSAADRRRHGRARVHELHIGRRHVLSFVGELDLATTPTLDDAIAAAIERGAAQVWVDLRQTPFMDSSGVHCLLRAKGTLSRLNRDFAVVCEAGPVRRVLALTGADRAIATFPDRAAAHQAA